jgi:hypothetical protein
VAVEGIVNGHYSAWKRGEPTPLKAALDAMYARWLTVGDGERLALEWPVHPLPGAVAQGRPPRSGRHGEECPHVHSTLGARPSRLRDPDGFRLVISPPREA